MNFENKEKFCKLAFPNLCLEHKLGETFMIGFNLDLLNNFSIIFLLKNDFFFSVNFENNEEFSEMTIIIILVFGT